MSQRDTGRGVKARQKKRVEESVRRRTEELIHEVAK